MSKKVDGIKYFIGDFIGSAAAWTLLFVFRKAVIEPEKYGYKVPIFSFDKNYFIAVCILPIMWVTLFGLFGSYVNVYRKSRVGEFVQTFILSFFGALIIFFVLLLDDEVRNYQVYRITFFTYFSLQFLTVFLLRIMQLSNIKKRLKNRKIGYNTILVGSNQKAIALYNELENERYSQGYRFVGYVGIENGESSTLKAQIPFLGNYKNISALIDEYEVEETLLAVESSEHPLINDIISKIASNEVNVRVLPDMYDLVAGSVKMNYIFGTALIEIMPDPMPVWQKNLKRIIDILSSVLVLVIGSPFYLALIIGVRLSSKGNIFYKQERIGKKHKPFMIYKFRTMYTNAEDAGPQLSSKDDSRITPFGRTLRKYRLDEFPQFYNVLIGDMSLVGPRPERRFFIDKIIEQAPQYLHLHKVKPGITSWGQIKYGYAENVEEMIQRMKFDILYVENMSIAMDFKILFYTVLIIVQGRGK
ncbi:MAG: sugar transferase [Bacteroidetes bacterium]|nr:sugar transferase [Bacteroidota bacterium]